MIPAPGITEGLNAGMWSVGLAVSGNELRQLGGIFQQMSAEEIAARRARRWKPSAAGAHYVGYAGGFTGVIADINQPSPAQGERP